MANMFQQMYKQKVKRVRDPNLPPPENLFSQGKKIRDVTASVETTQMTLQQQQEEIGILKRKLTQALYRIDTLTQYLRNTRK
jgi:hypothetical protein